MADDAYRKVEHFHIFDFDEDEKTLINRRQAEEVVMSANKFIIPLPLLRPDGPAEEEITKYLTKQLGGDVRVGIIRSYEFMGDMLCVEWTNTFGHAFQARACIRAVSAPDPIVAIKNAVDEILREFDRQLLG